MRVGSNPTPVRKRFERDEAEPSADKFYHTGTSIQDDSVKQKKTKKSQRRLWLITERLQTAQKKDTQTRHVKHESTRGFERKSFHMDDTNRLADYISELKKIPNGKAANRKKKKCVDGNKAEWPSGLRSQAQENPQSRILVHECVRGFESHSCQKTFWTRWDRAFSWQILSNWNVNWRWQSKAKNKKIATSSVVDNRAASNSTKKRYPNETCETRMYAWV